MADVVKTLEAVEQALALLRAGELVALPTETVYGLAADATNGVAVAKIFEAKGRPHFNPLIAHVDGFEMAERLVAFDPLSAALAEKFWPGPLTLVLPLAAGSAIHPLVTAGLDTLALRMPQGPAAGLIAQLGKPLAMPSANRSGRITATTAQAVADDLGDRIRLVVDGGPTPVGVESTIVKVEAGRLYLLRPGGVTTGDLEAATGLSVERTGGKIEAPGMMASHYAPASSLRLNVREVRAGEALLAFGPQRAAGAGHASTVLNLSASGDLREAASNLFVMMKALDRRDIAAIAVEPVPATGLGEAINDRLTRAAAPRHAEPMEQAR